ncbi:MAG: carboxylesterase family protein, partial [Ekhidna sp.]|nr:carboxylesterase family protein [Ekhidna sp.]
MRDTILIAFALLITACSQDDTVLSPEENTSTLGATPTVSINSTFEVSLEEDIVYAEGLSHETLNSANHTTMPLRLDIYTPDNDAENRPLFVFIHGGAFIGGSKQQAQIIDLAHYFASRGWVFISINYRLRGDIGTVPDEWVDYAINNLPSEGISQFLAMYPAHRDAKAAMRWIIANSDRYKIDEDYITVGGGSAGAITAITLGISNPKDYTNEIDSNQDPTLSTTNLDRTYQIKTIVDFWGSKVGLDALEAVYGFDRFDSNDPPLFIAHGT